jgi:hypothetical protein
MGTATSKNSQCETIACIETDVRGKQSAKTAQFVTVGYDDPRTNRTVDRHLCPVSSGNTLASLIRNSGVYRRHSFQHSQTCFKNIYKFGHC